MKDVLKSVEFYVAAAFLLVTVVAISQIEGKDSTLYQVLLAVFVGFVLSGYGVKKAIDKKKNGNGNDEGGDDA